MAPPPKRKSIRRQRSQQLASEHGDSSAKARGQSWREQIVGRFLVIHQVLIEALRPYPNILNATERAGAIVDRVTSQPKNAIQKWHGQLNANISLVVDGFERQKQMIIDYINLVKQKFSKQSVKELIQWVQQRIEVRFLFFNLSRRTLWYIVIFHQHLMGHVGARSTCRNVEKIFVTK